MIGFGKYMAKSCWNKLDLAIVVTCNLLFIISIISHASVEYISEEILLVAWSIAQSLRMIIIARKQRQALRSAKNLIDFSNIGFDTERVERSQQPKSPGGVEEEIVFDMHRSNSASYKNGGTFKRSSSQILGGSESSKKYKRHGLIEDEDDDNEESFRDKHDTLEV